MADVSKYGTKARRLTECLAHSQAADDEPSSRFELPILRSVAEARAFGVTMTRDQYLLLEGARLVLKRNFDVANFELKRATAERAGFLTQWREDVLFQGQMLREALDAAPDNVLASLLS